MRNLRLWRATVAFIALAGAQVLSSQTRRTAGPKSSGIRVPFVPCKSDGQAGPVDAPEVIEKFVDIDPSAASKLAYYESAVTQGLLAPRGWHCFGLYGSSGSDFYVKPDPIDETHPFSQPDFTGPVVLFSHTWGQGSGTFQVSQVVARAFPKRWDYGRRAVDLYLASGITYGPFPSDKLTYKGDELIEYITAPNSSGLGTIALIKPSTQAIEGFALLQGQTPDLLMLAVRLPPKMRRLTSQIVKAVELEALTQPSER